MWKVLLVLGSPWLLDLTPGEASATGRPEQMVLKAEGVGQAPWPPWSRDNTVFVFSAGWQCQPMSAGKLRSSGCPGPRGPISTSLDPVIDPKVELRGTEPPLYLKILSLLLKLCSVFYFQNYFFCQINLYIILFIFGCARSLLLLGLFSSCGKHGLLSSCRAQTSHYSGFSCWGARALGRLGFSSWGTWVQWLWLPGCRAQAQ